MEEIVLNLDQKFKHRVKIINFEDRARRSNVHNWSSKRKKTDGREAVIF